MAKFSCCLCDGEVDMLEYDLQKTFTTTSKTSLWMLLQSCVVEDFFMTNFLICKLCYLLLNELDSIKTRVKTIEDKLKNYLHKYSVSSDHKQIDNNKDEHEECRICLKKVASKEFKTHLKTHNSELNDLEASFDFDEVHSISEISPSLEDINLVNSEENDGKSDIKIEICDSSVKKGKVKRSQHNLKPYNCTMCSKTWKTVAELKNHMSSHSNEKPFICEICGQAYKRQQALTIHVGMHKGINPYTCVYCKKSFTQKGALVRHTPIHTGELPFQCDLCGKRFVHHTSFNIHKLSHTGEKSHKCEVCGLLLISGSHLKRHMRVHTGEKRFSCSTCGKKFAEKYNLAVHEKLHLGVSKRKKFQCHICDNLYNGQIKLQEHLLNVHQKLQYPNASEVTYTGC